MCRRAPACQAVLDQASARWPLRDKTADGICASSTHTEQNPGSDHEPHVDGYATAVDLTDDKGGGCDADAWAEHLRASRDPRVKYVICNRRMFSSYSTSTCPAWTWRPYTGPNPHEHHTHLSIQPTAINATGLWFPPAPVHEEDDMPKPTDIVDALDTPADDGVWLLQRDGGVITKGRAAFYGSYPGLPPGARLDDPKDGIRSFVAIKALAGGGYKLIADDGAVYRFKKPA